MDKNQLKILHVEDSILDQEMIQQVFNGHHIHFASTQEEAQMALDSLSFDVIILDLGLKQGDGLRLCQKIRMDTRTKKIPLLILSGKGEVSDRVLGLEMGADDYLVKPCNLLELKARVIALQRRQIRDGEEKLILRHGGIELDSNTFSVRIHDKGTQTINELTSLEFRLLRFFIENVGRIVSREQLLNYVWGNQVNITDRNVDAKISNLRKKIQPFGSMIRPVYGSGYMMSDLNQFNVKNKQAA